MKYNTCKIILVTFAFVLIISTMISTAYALENIGNYDTRYIVVGENYVAKLPQALNVPVITNNRFLIPLNPQILINGKISTITLAIDSELIERPAERFVFEGSATKQNVEISETIEMNAKSMTSRVSFRNKGEDDANIKITYGLEFEGKASLFFPYLVDNLTKNYMVAADPSLEGNGMGIVTNFDITSLLENFENLSSWIVEGNVKLEPGQTTEFSVIFYFFNIQKPGERTYPIELSSFLSEPLVKISGSVENISINETVTDKVGALVSKIDTNKIGGRGEFTNFHDVNFDSSSFDSLGMSAYFKELCAQVDIPCRLVVGRIGGESYAWVRAYDNNWVDVDPYTAVKRTPTGFSIYYEEPQFEVIVLSDENMERAYLSATNFLASLGQTLFLVYLVIIVIAGVAIVMIFQLKPTKIGEYIGVEKKGAIRKVEVGGEYEILKREIEDPFLHEILRKIIENNGKVDIKRFADELHYSPELIRSGITYLTDKKCIKQKKIELAVEEAEAVPGVPGIPPAPTVPKRAPGKVVPGIPRKAGIGRAGFFTRMKWTFMFNVKKLTDALKSMNKKQLQLLVAVVFIAIIILLLILLI